MKIGNQTLLLGDSLQIIRRIPDNSIDAIITDPPYQIQTCAANGGRRQNNKLGPHQADAALRTVGDLSMFELAFHGLFVELARILKPTGRFFVFCDARSYPSVMRAAYGKFKRSRLLVWDKTHFGLGQEFRKQFELVFSACQDACPMATVDGRPIADQSDILKCPPVPPKQRLHPAQKPVELIENLLRYCTPGGRVLDPFAGSASTLAACAASGFHGIGIECEKTFFDMAAARLQAIEDAKSTACAAEIKAATA